MRDTEHLKTYTLQEPKEQRIKPNDELYIRVSSFDEVAFNFFNNQTESRSMSMGQESISLISYIVKKNGNIYFPILGEVYVENLTLLEATNKLKGLLSDYFNQPTVLIKFVNKKVSVLGAVQQPGHYPFTENDLTVLQALGMAGDITTLGNRKEVTLMREINGELNSIVLDMSKTDFLTSEYYYIQPGDILYVQPLRASKWSINSLPYNLLLTSITTSLLIINFITQQK